MHLAIFDIIDSMKDSINGAFIIEQETTLDSMAIVLNKVSWQTIIKFQIDVRDMGFQWFKAPWDTSVNVYAFKKIRYSNSVGPPNYHLIVVLPVVHSSLHYLNYDDSISLQSWGFGCCFN